MKILCIGDVVGSSGTDFITNRLWGIRKLTGADFVVCNGENASPGNGLLPADAQKLFDGGVDVITTGNHVWNRRELYGMLEDNVRLLRPHNYPPEAPGTGIARVKTPYGVVEVVSLMGLVYMASLACPFHMADAILARDKGAVKIRIIDFHAEATSEKKALACYVDGRATAVVGTHTHVQTADEQVLPGGTAFITDLGMTGPTDSILGVGKAEVIEKFLVGLPVRFKPGEGEVVLCGALIEADPETGKAISIERICIS